MKRNKTMKLGIIILALVVSTISFAQDKMVDQIVAIVGGNIILKSEVERMHIEQQAQGLASDGDMKCEILENFLIDKLLIAES